METKFEIKITTGDMFRFLMYHTYHGFSGIFSICAAAGLIAFYLWRGNHMTNGWIYLFFGVLFLVYLPWKMYTNAVRQVKLGDTFKKPLEYSVAQSGIGVRQGEASGQSAWDSVTKVRETRSSILVYTGARTAYIWPKKQLGADTENVREALRKYAPRQKISLKNSK